MSRLAKNKRVRSEWAFCGYCRRRMDSNDGCIKVPLRRNGRNVEPIKFGEESNGFVDFPTNRCPDCNTPKGKYHHPGCDWERCPDCGGQAFGCPCNDD